MVGKHIAAQSGRVCDSWQKEAAESSHKPPTYKYADFDLCPIGAELCTAALLPMWS